MKFDKEFKEAVLKMPEKEKDKLLLRLLKKDIKLVNRLYFELVDEATVEERRRELELKIIERCQYDANGRFNGLYLRENLGYLSGNIQEHLYITKDKYGEVRLTLKLLTEALESHKAVMRQRHYGEYKLNIYIINKIFKLLGLISKMHPDLYLDFKEELVQLASLVSGNHTLMMTCINNGLDMNWLLNTIPEDILQIPKDLRARGFLR